MKTRLWPGIVFGLLGLNVAVVTVTIVAANSDPSFGVEPGYDTRAAAWNQTARQHAANRALGWSATAPAPVTGAPLRILLSGRHGEPVSGAGVTVEAFQHARSRARRHAAMDEFSPGEYRAATLAPDATGVWEVRLRAMRGPDVFTAELTVVVVPQDASP